MKLLLTSLTAVLFLLGIGGGAFVLWQASSNLEEMNQSLSPYESYEAEEVASSEHGAQASAASGHGEAQVAEENKFTVAIKDIYVNVLPESQYERVHYLKLQLELDLFDMGQQALVELNEAGLRNLIIELTRKQKFRELRSLTGKLLLKERLISGMNEFLHYPAVRDVHFASFLLQ